MDMHISIQEMILKTQQAVAEAGKSAGPAERPIVMMMQAVEIVSVPATVPAIVPATVPATVLAALLAAILLAIGPQ